MKNILITTLAFLILSACVSNKTVQTVKISDLNDGIFYACMEIEGADFGFRSIDARPSDAIAVALRLNTPILVSPEVMNEASVLEESLVENKTSNRKVRISVDALKEKLKSAIEKEEYEMAAKLRDKISEMES